MWDRIRRDMESGLKSLRWAGRFLAERTKVETSLAKVVFDSQKIQKKIDDKLLDLGRDVYELRDDRDALQNATVRDLLSEITSLKEELDFYLARARDLGGRPPEEVEDEETPAGGS